jgi:hypothetical protein
MKLDKDLVREILLKLEADQSDPRDLVPLEITGHSQLEIAYHVHLLADAGFLEALDLGSFDGYDWQPKHLTYTGHEFLDTVRDPEIWRETKDGASKIGAASVQLLWEIGKGILKAKAKQHLGIEL